MKKNNVFTNISLMACIAIVITCFIPWVHFNSINETFTGYHVTKFANGTSYGKPWKVICLMAAIIFILNFVNSVVVKKANLFVAALLLAYCIRTYFLFTGSLFEGEVSKLAGIYLILLLSLVLLVCAAFPNKVINKQ